LDAKRFAASIPFRWDTSSLYTTGEVTLTSVPEPKCGLLTLCTAIPCLALRAKVQETVAGSRGVGVRRMK
jgi:hypothetical protein